jgi:hypothetical protein
MTRVCAATLALLVLVSFVLHPTSRVLAQPAPPDALTRWHQSFAPMAGRHIALYRKADAQDAQQPLTVRQLYHQVEARLAQSGKIYKALIRRTTQGGGFRRTDVTQVWVDARRELARQQTTERFTSGQHTQTYTITSIAANGTTYTRVPVSNPGQPAVQTSPVFTCQGAHIAASVILGCPNPVQTWTMSLQPGRYAGRQVLVLLRKDTDTGEGSSGTYVTRIYIDRQTLLPLAEKTTGTMNMSPAPKPTHGRATYVTSLVAPSSLPASFFQPSSIGYRGRSDEIRQEMKPVPSGFTVLWLGLDVTGGQGLPALSLQRAVPGEGGKDTFSIELYYMPANNLFGKPLLYMEEWSSAAAARHPKPPTGSGWSRQTVKLANGHAVILSGRGSMAFAYIGSTVALIEPTGSALSSVPALQTIVRALRPYVPHA